MEESKKTVIPHGIDTTSLVFQGVGGKDMLWMSRIDHLHMDKGMTEAMTIANTLKRKLHVTGFVESGSRTYVDEILRPLVKGHVTFEEQDALTPVNKNDIFGSAKLFLFPTQWEESFGLVLLEAMACGTPVVAYARGAIPEIVADGVTGFVVNPSENDIRGDFVIKKTGKEGMREAIERIYAMNPTEYARVRLNCRAHIEKYFTVSRMVDEYEHLYTALK